VRGFVLGTAAVDLAIIAYGAINSSNAFRDAGWGLVAWVAVVAAVAQHGAGEGTRIPSEASFDNRVGERRAPRRDPP
jgi:hypothetical protein